MSQSYFSYSTFTNKLVGLFIFMISFMFSLVPIQFEPMLPGYKREMLKHMPIGSYLKFIFVFDKVFVIVLS